MGGCGRTINDREIVRRSNEGTHPFPTTSFTLLKFAWGIKARWLSFSWCLPTARLSCDQRISASIFPYYQSSSIHHTLHHWSLLHLLLSISKKYIYLSSCSNTRKTKRNSSFLLEKSPCFTWKQIPSKKS